MGQLLTNFGVDWKLLLAQVVNFGILFWVLKRYAYQPILDVLKNRETIIKKGLEDASNAEKELKNVHIEANVIRGDAKKEAHALLQTAHNEGKDIVTTAVTEGQTKKAEIVGSAERDIEEIRKRNEYQLRQKSAEHIIAGVKAILQEEMTGDLNSRIIRKLTAGSAQNR
jgi:F-type H+-transporting ATPase subunit b